MEGSFFLLHCLFLQIIIALTHAFSPLLFWLTLLSLSSLTFFSLVQPADTCCPFPWWHCYLLQPPSVRRWWFKYTVGSGSSEEKRKKNLKDCCYFLRLFQSFTWLGSREVETLLPLFLSFSLSRTSCACGNSCSSKCASCACFTSSCLFLSPILGSTILRPFSIVLVPSSFGWPVLANLLKGSERRKNQKWERIRNRKGQKWERVRNEKGSPWGDCQIVRFFVGLTGWFRLLSLSSSLSLTHLISSKDSSGLTPSGFTPTGLLFPPYCPCKGKKRRKVRKGSLLFADDYLTGCFHWDLVLVFSQGDFPRRQKVISFPCRPPVDNRL